MNSQEVHLKGSKCFKFLSDNFDWEKSKKQIKQGFIFEGGGGAAKTYDILHFIILYCSLNPNKHKDILICRNTNADLQKTIVKDWVKILLMYDLYNEKFHFKSHPQHFNLYGNTIYFSGMDAMGSHGERHDIIFVNEILETEQLAFQQLNQRCNECFIGDYNPSYTDHWVYNSICSRSDTKFFKVTCLDNPFLPQGQRDEILAYNPTAENIKNGTADDFMWKVYGLGLRTAAKGLIFKYVEWIDELPEDFRNFGLDFGFTNDPTCLSQFGLKGNNLYAKSLLYEPIDNAPALSQALENAGVHHYDNITADCSDKYNDAEMVRELKNMGWNIKKVNKGKGISWRIGLLKKHKLCLVNDLNVKREQENYKWREINGISINEPLDKYNHFWDSLGYGYLGIIKNTILTSGW
jgi:PBSX family phage terminase large subunit